MLLSFGRLDVAGDPEQLGGLGHVTLGLRVVAAVDVHQRPVVQRAAGELALAEVTSLVDHLVEEPQGLLRLTPVVPDHGDDQQEPAASPRVEMGLGLVGQLEGAGVIARAGRQLGLEDPHLGPGLGIGRDSARPVGRVGGLADETQLREARRLLEGVLGRRSAGRAAPEWLVDRIPGRSLSPTSHEGSLRSTQSRAPIARGGSTNER